MLPEQIKCNAERWAADDLGFQHVVDAKSKSPSLFLKIYEERLSFLFDHFKINPSELYAQASLF